MAEPVATARGRLDGKVAIVTGTSPNIGGALARGLARQGAKVVCTDLIPEVAEQCAERIQTAGGTAIAMVGDVTDDGHAADVVAEAIQRWGRLDVLVNNAVMFKQSGLLTMSVEHYRRQLDVILTGAFLFTRAAAQAMITAGNGGSIVNILSTAAWQGQPGNIGYTTAKSGMINFTRSAAMELAEHDIRVNGLTPTATVPDDPSVAERGRAIASESAAWTVDFAGHMPMGRLPGPEDYVGALLFLVTDDSAMMTGSNVSIDGGATAKYWPWVPRSAPA